MAKRDPLRTSFLFLLVAFLVIFAAGAFVANMKDNAPDIRAETLKITGNSVIRVPNSESTVPNPTQGTLVLWTKKKIEVFDQFRDARDYIIFFTADNMPGFRIAYNIADSRFEAGMPILATPQVNIFDNTDHQFVYTWNKDIEQALYLDGKKVRSSKFLPVNKDMIVGMSIADIEQFEEVDVEGIDITYYDKFMTEEELQKI